VAETTRDLRVDLTLSDAELDALEQALLKARASELSEVRRRDVRLTAGYGDPTNRDVMGDEAAAAQLRYDVISSLLDVIRAARA
jgi:hypothetical protein